MIDTIPAKPIEEKLDAAMLQLQLISDVARIGARSKTKHEMENTLMAISKAAGKKLEELKK